MRDKDDNVFASLRNGNFAFLAALSLYSKRLFPFVRIASLHLVKNNVLMKHFENFFFIWHSAHGRQCKMVVVMNAHAWNVSNARVVSVAWRLSTKQVHVML